MEGNGHDLILDFLPQFALKTDVEIYGVPTEIRIGYSPNRRRIPYSLNQLPRQDALEFLLTFDSYRQPLIFLSLTVSHVLRQSQLVLLKHQTTRPHI
jgi:hypothetical protein